MKEGNFIIFLHYFSVSCSIYESINLNTNFRLTNIYGIPSYEYPGMTKILLHGGPEAHPDYRDVPSVDEEVKYVSDYVKKHLPGLSSPIQTNSLESKFLGNFGLLSRLRLIM